MRVTIAGSFFPTHRPGLAAFGAWDYVPQREQSQSTVASGGGKMRRAARFVVGLLVMTGLLGLAPAPATAESPVTPEATGVIGSADSIAPLSRGPASPLAALGSANTRSAAQVRSSAGGSATSSVDSLVVGLAASLDNNPNRIFNWVRDSIVFEPGWGLELGSRGCLLARRCSAHDTSLLLW